MAKIFINYRSSDTAAMAVLLETRLSIAFGANAIFRDDRDIPAGADFREHLLEKLAECKVMLVVIGKQWLDLGPEGLPKLHDAEDWVRLEIIEALELGMNVAPMLVNGAQRLDVTRLPDPLKPLAYRQYRYIRERSANHDIDALIEELAGIIDQEPAASPAPEPAPAPAPKPRATVEFHDEVVNTGIMPIGDHHHAIQQQFNGSPPPRRTRRDG